jgi:hypothetical protein
VFFSPDGKTMATCHEGKFVNLWKIPFRKPLWSILAWALSNWLAAVLFYWAILRLRRRLLKSR